ncbi:unnamed protein product [Notodromas monacha]|uniref:Uncharacterized protein n=1 Tax=Notodromas monacha TaxID=399045 RepID=A0A7R9BEF5_9CRUS|nr:unnamed protein product [Notodromas monacha]CAG0912250.1 unnamed protein product [Notodromas monacha]
MSKMASNSVVYSAIASSGEDVWVGNPGWRAGSSQSGSRASSSSDTEGIGADSGIENEHAPLSPKVSDGSGELSANESSSSASDQRSNDVAVRCGPGRLPRGCNPCGLRAPGADPFANPCILTWSLSLGSAFDPRGPPRFTSDTHIQLGRTKEARSKWES